MPENARKNIYDSTVHALTLSNLVVYKEEQINILHWDKGRHYLSQIIIK